MRFSKDRAAIQAQINGWAAETGLSHAHISHILAFSIGENRISVCSCAQDAIAG